MTYVAFVSNLKRGFRVIVFLASTVSVTNYVWDLISTSLFATLYTDVSL